MKNDEVDDAPSAANNADPLVAMVMLKKGGRTLEEVAKKSEMVKSASGVEVPIPTRPPLVTMNDVAVDEPMTNAGAPLVSPLGLMDSMPHGVDEPTPRNPAEVRVVVPVPPKAAVKPDTEFANRALEDA